MLFSSFLLVSNCFLATLASACIVLGALTANRKPDTVTDASVATDVHKALDVELNLRTEVALYFIFSLDNFANGGCWSSVQSCTLMLRSTPALPRMELVAAAYAVDIRQGNLSSFILRQIYADYSYCHSLLLQIFCKGNKIILDVV